MAGGTRTWQVRNYVATGSADRLLEDLSREERAAVARTIYMTMAQALAPTGVEVRVRNTSVTIAART